MWHDFQGSVFCLCYGCSGVLKILPNTNISIQNGRSTSVARDLANGNSLLRVTQKEDKLFESNFVLITLPDSISRISFAIAFSSSGKCSLGYMYERILYPCITGTINIGDILHPQAEAA